MTTVRVETITAGDYPVAVHVRAHDLRADVGASSGGADSAPGAHDYFDASLAACKALTAFWYARKNAMPRLRLSSVRLFH